MVRLTRNNPSTRFTQPTPTLCDTEQDLDVGEFDEAYRSTQFVSQRASSMTSRHSSDMTRQEEQQVASINADFGTSKKRGRGPTRNSRLAKKKARGEKLDIQFPSPFFKVCGEDADLFKSEVTVCVKQLAPLQVDSWDKIADEDIKTMWRFLKDSLSLPEHVYPYVMQQAQKQYRNRAYKLHEAYREKKGRPNHVSLDDWQWLIENKWTTEKFKDKSIKYQINRNKQENGSITGTKSIVQRIHKMKDPTSEKLPDAVAVWKETRKRSDGTWKHPRGEEILNKLQEVAETHHEEISSAPVPLVEHFALVLGKRSGYSRGVGSGAITSSSQERQRIHVHVEAERKRANELEEEVKRLKEAMETQRTEMEAKMQQSIKDEVSVLFKRFTSNLLLPNQQSSSSSSLAPNSQDCGE